MSVYTRIAVLDIGKTNAKVVVLDAATGAEIAAARRANAVVKDGPYPHYDVEALWAFTLDAFRRFAREPGFDAISITTHGAAAALLAADGGLALPVLDYEHAYPQTIRKAYDALRPPFGETRSPRLPGGLNLGAQLHYQKTAFPEAFAGVATIVTYPQYWAARLTGVAASEATSLGCHTDLWNPQAGDYSALVDMLALRPLMAPIRSAFDALGPVLPEIAGVIGVSVPVYCGIHDSNASLLPHLVARQAPFSVVSTGTWVISFAVGGDLEHLDPARDTLANVDAHGRAVPSSRFMGGREFEILSAGIGPVTQADARAALPAAIGRRLMLTPNVTPGSGPFPGRQSRWLNAQGASAAERHAAVCLYLALMNEACLGLIGAKGPTVVEGPFAANGLHLTLLATLTGRLVIAVGGSTGTSQGAALLAGITPAPMPQTAVPPTAIAGLDAYRTAWLAEIGRAAS